MVFLRMSEAVRSEHRITLMNGWYLDTCKLLDLCLVYGREYPQAVERLIRNVMARGEELEDFHKDFQRVMELAYLRLKELCEEYEGFAEIDFARLQESSHLYQNFHNAESTLTRSLLKTLFSTYDLLRNLEAVLDRFPSRCRIRLLENVLLFKRIVMVYAKLRFHDDCVWRFGGKEALFRPFLQLLRATIVAFLARALSKVAQLLNILPTDSPYRTDLKRTFANFWYFTMTAPAVSYEHREDQQRLEKAAYHGRELGTAVIEQKGGELLLKDILGQFSRKASSYPSLTAALETLRSIGETQRRKEALEKLENWHLPSFSEFLKANYPQPPTLASLSPTLQLSQPMKEYEDEPLLS